MAKGHACVEMKKIDSSIHSKQEEKELVAAVISYPAEHNSFCLRFSRITSILVIHSLWNLL